MRLFVAAAVVLCTLSEIAAGSASAQESFELAIPGAQIRSTATLTDQTLDVTNAGTTHGYVRDRQYDTAGYRAYSSATLRRTIRWPIAGRGNMQIGTVTGIGAVTFKRSRMQVQRVGGGPPTTPPPPPPRPQPGPALDTGFFYRLHNAFLGVDRVLDGRRPSQSVALAGSTRADSQHWKFTPVAGGRYRLTNASLGPQWSLSVDRRGDVATAATTNTAAQHWRLVPQGRDVFQLVSDALNLPLDIDVKRGNALVVDKSDNWQGERWLLTRLYPVRPPAARGPRLVSRESRLADPLKPANVQFVNSHRRELWVAVTDRRDPQHPQRLKIPPGAAEQVQVERDPGELFVETWEVIGPAGDVIVEERVTRLPPRLLYDVSVYELIVQSISIDSTQRGKGRIEEMNTSPKSVGAFPLAAGDALVDQRIDVYKEAQLNRNPGGVRRLDLRQWSDAPAPLDPVERRLQQLR